MDEPRRVVLLGKTGAGKSSLANTIFGETVFTDNHTSKSGTEECKAETRCVNGRSITLIDTPGFFDTDTPEKTLKSAFVKCITECAPGPHAFLILLKVEKYTEHEQAVITKITECFSEEAFKYATVVFTHGDQLQQGQKIEDFVGENLKDLVKKCGGRCHVIDNKYWNNRPVSVYRSNKFQVERLLQTIDKMMKENNNDYYTNSLLQKVMKMIQEKMKKMKALFGNLPTEEIKRMAKEAVQSDLFTVFVGVSVGMLLGGFLGAAAMKVVGLIKPVSVAMTVAGAVVGAGIGGAAGYAAAASTGGEPPDDKKSK